MPTIIDASPLSAGEEVFVGGRAVRLLRGQPVVWLSISPRNVILLPSVWPRFPAVVDTGFNGTVLLGDQQLREWAGVNPRQLAVMTGGGAVWRIDGLRVPALQATVWLHPNRPGQRELSEGEPLALYPSFGILVTPPAATQRRLPLIGTELLQSCGLRVTFDPLTIDPALLRFDLQFTVHSTLE
jgi:hypothetical protein